MRLVDNLRSNALFYAVMFAIAVTALALVTATVSLVLKMG